MNLHPVYTRSVMLSAVVAGLALLLFVPQPASAQQGNVTVEKVEYAGWKNNLKISNGQVELIVTLDVGPRIISYRLKGGKNVFKEFTKQLGKAGEKDWVVRGGHRLWASPEDPGRTYFPDNGPVAAAQRKSGSNAVVIFKPEPEKAYGLQKEIEVQLAATGSKVKVTHRISNIGKKATELAPWALSVMDAGGVEIIPLPPKKPHPSQVKGLKPTPADFAPNQDMVLWPYFHFTDPRYTFGSKYIVLRQDAKRGPTKIGLAHRMSWIGYLNNGTLFVKRIKFQEGQTYPDHGVNFETFTNPDMLEVETLGPLVTLAPGAATEHVEEWELFGKVKPIKDEASIDKNILPLVAGK